MANTTATTAYRAKWFSSNIQATLKAALVAEKICQVDRSDSKYIWNPYGAAPTTVVQTIIGTYTPATYTTTNDTLEVINEFIVSEHIYDFESVLGNYDMFASRTEEMVASVATSIDKSILNALCEDATGAYTTPAGGFATATNVGVITSEICGKVAGYADAFRGLYCVIENTDLPGVLQYEATAGFSFADSALNNGFVKSIMGVDFYVVRSGTFADGTYMATTCTNVNHRVAGVKGVSTYAAPRGIQYDEKTRSGYTGKEVVVWGYLGFKAWYNKLTLTIDITLV